MNESLAYNLIAAAERYPDRPALRIDDAVITYAELDDATARVAGLLRDHGLEPGDRVGIMLPNVPQFAIAYYGVLRAGGVVVPMNVLLKQREVAFYLGDSEAKLIFAWHEFAAAAEAGAGETGTECLLVEPDAFGQLLASVAEPVREVVERAAARRRGDPLHLGHDRASPRAPSSRTRTSRSTPTSASSCSRLGPEDVILGALPLFHAFGQTCALNAAISAGASLALIPRFDPDKALETVERDRVTIFEGVPTMYAALLHHPVATSST